MGKSRNKGRLFFTQQNGRERGLPGNGNGPWQETSPMGHATVTKTKGDIERREARKAKERRWEED